MPVALSKPERSTKLEIPHDIDNRTSPFPAYSGQLLKLGSNDRWQSRLFTFDGSVLVCVGKKPKAPVIMTYDPHVSSPFLSSSCNPSPLNPNTKWFINIASVTEIKLLSISRFHNCFPFSDTSKELSIQANDGRNITLRASKDIELDRWYFVLSKIWEYQQQKSEAPVSPTPAKDLAAHQQSANLFQRYLKKQYPESQQEQTQVQRSSSNQLRPHQKIPRDSLLPYQIPAPPRVSAFLPQGLDFPEQEQDDEDNDGVPAKFLSSFYESQSINGGEGHHPERHNSKNQQRQSMCINPSRQNEIGRSASTGMMPQRSDCPAANTMEPRKAAIIDSWRRSLLLPKRTEDRASQKLGDVSPMSKDSHVDRVNGDDLFDLDCPRPESGDLESTLKHSSLGLECGAHNGIDVVLKATEQEASLGHGMWGVSNKDIKDGYRKSIYGANQIEGQVNRRLTYHPGLTAQPLRKNEDFRRSVMHINQDETVQDLVIQSANDPRTVPKEDDELPLGLIQSKRHSRWMNTQLSSEDGVSVVQQHPRESSVVTPHKLLPSEPITPERTRSKLGNNSSHQPPLTVSSREMQLEHHSLDIYRLTPSLSNPSLSLHGSSYSHLPIQDPDFVFSNPVLNMNTSANELMVESGVMPQSSLIPSAHNMRHGFNTLTPTSGISGQKYIPVDTTPYTTITNMNSNPPARPIRPHEDLSPMLPESDNMMFAVQSQPVTYRHRPKLSLSRSISAMSSVSQAHLRRHSPQQLSSPYQQHSHKLSNDREGDEDENEPLGLTLSRQQSNKQQHRQSLRIYPDQRRMSMVSQTSPGIMRPKSATLLQPNFEHVPLRSSGASFSYF
ncbi:hypothetical protein BGZ76_008819 [Entomortierella beljakovae]|nr:hypothetical protein BGZ76_008819 [Entomortierella beljakovae]